MSSMIQCPETVSCLSSLLSKLQWIAMPRQPNDKIQLQVALNKDYEVLNKRGCYIFPFGFSIQRMKLSKIITLIAFQKIPYSNLQIPYFQEKWQVEIKTRLNFKFCMRRCLVP